MYSSNSFLSQLGTAPIAKQPHTQKGGGTPPIWTESIYIIYLMNIMVPYGPLWQWFIHAVIIRDSQTHGFGTCIFVMNLLEYLLIGLGIMFFVMPI